MKLRKNTLHPLHIEWLPPEPDTNDATIGFITQDGVARAVRSLPIPELLALPAFHASIERPVQLLQAYEQDRNGSLLGRIFKLANRSHHRVDRVVVFAPPKTKLAIESVWSTCCQPYWNELTRGDRGSKPRISFVGHELDNDAVQGMLHLIGAHRDIQAREVTERWGVVIIEPGDSSPRSELALHSFVPALQRQLSFQPELFPECVVAVSPADSEWLIEYKRAGLFQILELPEDESSWGDPFSAAVLFPAALLGINVMELVAGAAAGSRSAESAHVSSGSPLHLAMSNAYRDSRWKILPRAIHLWGSALEPIGHWYQSLVEGAMGGLLATSRIGSCASEFALHSSTEIHRSPQPPPYVCHHITTERWRFDELLLGEQGSLPLRWNAQWQEVVQWHRHSGIPQTRIHLPVIDELHIGQLLQWLFLATVTESWLQQRT